VGSKTNYGFKNILLDFVICHHINAKGQVRMTRQMTFSHGNSSCSRHFIILYFIKKITP